MNEHKKFGYSALTALVLVIIFLIIIFGIDVDAATLPVRGDFQQDGVAADFDSVRIEAYWAGTSLQAYESVTTPASYFAVILTVDSSGWFDVIVRWYDDGETYYSTDNWSRRTVADLADLPDSAFEDISYIANHPEDFKADVSALAQETSVTALRDSADEMAGVADVSALALEASLFDPTVDTVYNVARVAYVDSVETLITDVGATAVVDTESIARAVWDDDLIAEGSRTIGNPGGTGTGAYPETLVVLRSVDSTAIAGLTVRVYNSTESASMASAGTDANGVRIMSLDAAVYHVYINENEGYSQGTRPDTITLTSSGHTDTIWVSAYNPGAPSTPGLCNVYGWAQNLSAIGLESYIIKFAANEDSDTLVVDGIQVSQYEVVDTLDSDGYFEKSLYPSVDINSTYKVSLYRGPNLVRRISSYSVPDSTTHLFVW